MHFSFLNILIQYYGPVFFGIAAAVICKAYFAAKLKNKIKDYENDLMKSREKVFELEILNKNLQERLKEMEGYFSKDKIIMN